MRGPIEERVQAMLRTRAGDIGSLPADFLHLAAADVLDCDPILDLGRTPGPGRRRSTWLVAAAVVAVLALAGGLAAYSSLRGHEGTTQPATSGTPAPVVPTTSLSQCRIALPAAWRAAVTSATNRFAHASQPGDLPLAVLADGSSVISRGAATTGYKVLEIAPSGATRTLLTLPESAHLIPDSAVLTGRNLVLQLNYMSAGAGGGAVLAISVIDVGSGREVRHIALQSVADSLRDHASLTSWVAAADGQIFWDTARWDRTGTITRLDLATGARKIVYSGTAQHPLSSAAGVYFVRVNGENGAHITVPAAGVPAAVLAATDTQTRLTLATDGQHWAWFDQTRDRIGWYDGRQLRYVRAPLPELPRLDDSPGDVHVAGDIVTYQSADAGAEIALDMRTGAAAPLPIDDNVVATYGSIVLGYGDGGGHSPHPLLRFDTSTLPELSC